MKLWCALLLITPLSAHSISMSHGMARVEGSTVVYQLRMPEYELAHISDPERTFFSAIQFFSGGVEGKLVQRACRSDPGFGAFICDAVYQFPRPIDTLTVN